MSMAGIYGTFADLKTVKTRSVVQMVIEVPIERGAEIVAAFGFPRPGEEVPVAVARLDPNVIKPVVAALEKPRTPFHDKPLSVQAGIRCINPKFWEFMRLCNGWPEVNDQDAAAHSVRQWCDVDSRKKFDTSDHAARKWIALNAEFEQWAGLAPESR